MPLPRRTDAPSFAHSMGRANRHKESPYVRALLDKATVRSITEVLGGRVPRLVANLSSIAALAPDLLDPSSSSRRDRRTTAECWR